MATQADIKAQRAAEDALIASIPVPLKRGRQRVGDFEINYVKGGKGPPLILLHGLNVGWGQWYDNIPGLCEQFTVYAIDMPGAGGSTWMRHKHMDLDQDYIQVLEGFIAALDLRDVTLVGHSFGGWLALSVAAKGKAPLRCVSVNASLGFSDVVPPQYKAATITPLLYLVTGTALKPSHKTMSWLMTSVMCPPGRRPVTPEFVDYFYKSARMERQKHPFFVVNRIANFSRMAPEMDLRPVLGTIKIPVHIIHGGADTLAPLDAAAPSFDAIPSAKLDLIKDLGHLPYLERPDTFNAAVIAFAKGCDAHE